MFQLCQISQTVVLWPCSIVYDSQNMQMNIASKMVGLFVDMQIKICEKLGRGDVQNEIFC